jgi:hypothetical protein
MLKMQKAADALNERATFLWAAEIWWSRRARLCPSCRKWSVQFVDVLGV